MTDIEYFKAIHGATGCSNKKEIKTNRVQHNFAQKFDSSINVTYTALRNDVQQDFIIVPKKDVNQCNIFPRPGEDIQVGDIIAWNGLHWLVIDKDYESDVYDCATITRCNRLLRWQNPETYEIIERWCLCTKPYTSNLDEGKTISVSNREFKVQLPYDDETSKVDLDKRFMLEVINNKPKSYVVTCVDAQTNKYQDIDGGFIIWNLSQDLVVRDSDNADLMICDYVDPTTHVVDDNKPLTCSIDGRETIKIGGSERNYVVTFYKEDGTVDSSVEAVFDVSVLPEHTHLIQTNQVDNVLTIRALDYDSLIDTYIKITAADKNGVYSPAEFLVKVVA